MTRSGAGRQRVNSALTSATLASTLRDLREAQEMSQAELARATGLRGSSYISRLESGEARAASVDLLDALSVALNDQSGMLHAAAGTIPGDAVRSLAPFHHAVNSPWLRDQTTPAVQRIDAAARAARVLEKASLPLTGRIDHQKLVAAQDRRLRTVSGEAVSVTFPPAEVVITRRDREPVPGEPGREQVRPGDLERVRFLAAHAVAHLALGEEACHWPRMTVTEHRAADIACHLLAPGHLLRLVLRTAMERPGTPSPWLADSAAIAAEVGRRLGIPGWVALRRLGDDGAYDEYAEDDE